MSQEPNPFAALSAAMADAVEKAAASTVLVDARRRYPASGIVFSTDLVLTADHIVEREEDVKVGLPDGSQVRAIVAGRDASNDLALLRLAQGGLMPAKPLLSAARVGQMVMAVGRPTPEGVQASLGVVSAIGGPVRTGRGGLLEQYLRTDTIFYPGFSGGPLIDAAGSVLGLNTSGLAHDVSLTIPASLAWKIAETLALHGHIRRGYLGVRSQPVELPTSQQEALGNQQASGLLLVHIEAGSPASSGGLLVGDILVGIGGEPVSDPDDLFYRLNGQVVGQPALIQVLRGGQPTTLTVVIGERK